MKQTINLLPAKAKHTKDVLAFSNIVILLALTFIGGLVVISSLWWQGKTSQDLTNLQLASNSQLQNQLSHLSNQLAERETPPQLILQLSNLQNQIQAMQQVSDLSITIDAKQSQGFLTTLQKVASSLPARSKLDQLRINSDKTLTNISGELHSIEALPLMLATLKDKYLLSSLTKSSGINNGSFYRFEVTSTLPANGGAQ